METLKIENYIESSKELPNLVFKPPFEFFSFIRFDEIFQNDLYSALVECNIVDRIIISVLSPDYIELKKLEFLYQKGKESFDFSNIFHEEIKIEKHDNPFNLDLYSHIEICVIYHDSLNWIVYADREFGCAIVAHKTESDRLRFNTTFNNCLTFVELIENLRQAFGESIEEIPSEIRHSFRKNYAKYLI